MLSVYSRCLPSGYQLPNTVHEPVIKIIDSGEDTWSPRSTHRRRCRRPIPARRRRVRLASSHVCSVPRWTIDSRPGGFCAQSSIHSPRSEEHTSELQSLMRISYAVFCLKKKTITKNYHSINNPVTITYN